MTGGLPSSPYAYSGLQVRKHFSPTFMEAMHKSQALITIPSHKYRSYQFYQFPLLFWRGHLFQQKNQTRFHQSNGQCSALQVRGMRGGGLHKASAPTGGVPFSVVPSRTTSFTAPPSPLRSSRLKTSCSDMREIVCTKKTFFIFHPRLLQCIVLSKTFLRTLSSGRNGY